MRTYKQTIRFEREFVITAKDAESANEKLQDAIRRVEWDSDVESEGSYEFEDEPVNCPKCNGNGVIGEDEQTCTQCSGDGCIPFKAED